MADSYHIIDGQVIPFSGGRRCSDTDAWRDATPLELQLQEQLAEPEHVSAAQAAEIESLRAEVNELREVLGRILENEAPDWKFREEFGGYVLDDELREAARAALAKGATN